jgi:hypothetical protein
MFTVFFRDNPDHRKGRQREGQGFRLFDGGISSCDTNDQIPALKGEANLNLLEEMQQ